MHSNRRIFCQTLYGFFVIAPSERTFESFLTACLSRFFYSYNIMALYCRGNRLWGTTLKVRQRLDGPVRNCQTGPSEIVKKPRCHTFLLIFSIEAPSLLLHYCVTSVVGKRISCFDIWFECTRILKFFLRVCFIFVLITN